MPYIYQLYVLFHAAFLQHSFKFHGYPSAVPLLCIFNTSAHNGELKRGWKNGQTTTSLKIFQILTFQEKENAKFMVLR